jgi:glutamate-1-semialdehyde 2,1-aminomutase
MADYNDTEGTRAILSDNASRLAAVILEPMLGSGGCIPADAAFLRMLREECTRHGILLIFDEVMTSRLAPGGLQERMGVLPDLTTLGKYLGGGFSFGAFGGRADILDRYDPSRPGALMHAGTFNNNPFTMHAGHAMVTRVYTPDRAAALNADGDALRARLQAIALRHSVPLTLSGAGSMLCLHVARGPVCKPADAIGTPEAEDAKSLIHLEMLARGYYFAQRGMMVLSLPMTQVEHDGLAQAFDEVLGALAGPLSRLA